MIFFQINFFFLIKYLDVVKGQPCQFLWEWGVWGQSRDCYAVTVNSTIYEKETESEKIKKIIVLQFY